MNMEFLEQNWMWALAALFSGGMLLWPLLTGQDKLEIDPAQATLMMNREDALLLDVREDSEWKSGHVPGARHVALSQLEKHLSELESFKGKPVIICCAAGTRSTAACAQMQKAGFGKVFSLAGGIQAWKEAKLPLTTKA